MLNLENAAQAAVLAEPCLKFASLVTTPVGRMCDGDPTGNREARRLVNEVRDWAKQFDAPDAKALVSAMDDMERLLICVWTEIAEATLYGLGQLPRRKPESAAEMRANAMSYLMRWNQGGY